MYVIFYYINVNVKKITQNANSLSFSLWIFMLLEDLKRNDERSINRDKKNVFQEEIVKA